MKNIKQNKQSKEQFESILVEPLLEKRWSKEELCSIYNLKDRELRRTITEISMHYPVVSHSKAKGYRISNVEKLLQENNVNHINSEIEELQHCVNELNSRIQMMKKRQKALISALKVLEKGAKDEQ